MTHWFNGGLDDVRLYDHALSDAEVGKLYQSAGGKGKALLNAEPLKIQPYEPRDHQTNAVIRAIEHFEDDGEPRKMIMPCPKLFNELRKRRDALLEECLPRY